MGRIRPVLRAPIQLTEADESQSGKGYKHKLIAAIYSDTPAPVQQNANSRGVGSMEEKFGEHLIAGNVFISFDNLRTRDGQPFGSQQLESFMTEDSYLARVPHKGNVRVIPCRTIVMATTNGCRFNVDLMNRTNPVAIRKRPEDYEYRQYSEGDVLARVHSAPERYLGAVFRVVREWHSAGCPRTDMTEHDTAFRPWAQTMDWIVQEPLNCAPLSDGLKAAQQRITSPTLQWIRSVAIAVAKADRLNGDLSASQIAEICVTHDVDVAGLDNPDDYYAMDTDDRKRLWMGIGSRLSKAFKQAADGEVLIDSFSMAEAPSQLWPTSPDVGSIAGTLHLVLFGSGGQPVCQPRGSFFSCCSVSCRDSTPKLADSQR